MYTLTNYKLNFNENHYTLTLTLLIKFSMCENFPWNKFTISKCLEKRLPGYQGLQRDYLLTWGMLTELLIE